MSIYCQPSLIDFGSAQLPLMRAFGKHFKNTPFKTFCYIRWYNDGKLLYLTNYDSWLNTYIKNQYFNVIKHIDCYTAHDKGGCHPWLSDKSDIVFLKAAELNIFSGINLCKANQDHAETFIFASENNNNETLGFYINHINTIKRLSKDFLKNYLPKVKFEKNQLLPFDKDVTDKIASYCLNASLDAQKKIAIGDNIFLSKKALTCLYWTCQGKSADEIAMILNISRRTVEDHFLHMKMKLNCTNKYQLIHKLHLLLPDMMIHLDNFA